MTFPPPKRHPDKQSFCFRTGATSLGKSFGMNSLTRHQMCPSPVTKVISATINCDFEKYRRVLGAEELGFS